MTDHNADPDGLAAAGVQPWLISMVGRMARDAQGLLDALLITVGQPVEITGTRAVCRTHFVRKDGNGRPRVKALAQHLAELVVDYCIPRSRVEEAREHHARTGSSAKFVRLHREACELSPLWLRAVRVENCCCTRCSKGFLRIPQILCKMPLKTNPQMHVFGTDGVHAKVLDDGRLALYWGESKLHATVASAVDDCFKSVAPFLLSEGDGAARRDLLLVRDNLDAGEQEVTAALIRFFDQDTAESSRVEFRAACLVGFDLSDYPDPHDSTGDQVQAEVAESINQWADRIRARVEHHELITFEIEVFCVPVPSVKDFRGTLRAELGLGA
jgi:hypothetical protein